MSKTKKIKGWLLALLTALLVCCLGFALAQILPASAAEDGVLEGNTAEYTIVNDSAHPWIYERGTNTWYNNADKSYGLKKVLTIQITSSGSIDFKYKANLYNTNTQGKTPSANNQNDFYLELTKGGVTNTIVALHGVKMPDYEQLTIDNLSAGDKLVFTHKLAGSLTSDDDRVYIQGLKKPADDSVTITANVSGSGKITCDEATEASVSKTVVSGSPVVLTAKPDSGNVFAYWTDSKGVILSYEDTLNLSPLATTSYTAHFVAENINAFTSYDGWEKTSNGYKLASTSVAKKVSTLTYEFIGEKYFDFSISHNLEKSGYNANSFATYLNGSTSAAVGGELPSFSQYNNFDGFDSTIPQFESGYIHVTGDGYHRLEFVYGMYKPYSGDPYFLTTTQDYFEIKNFEVSDTAKVTTTITLDYEKEYGTVYIDGAATDPGEVTVPKGVKVMFTASINSSVQSNIDSSQHVPVWWGGFFAHADSVNSYGNITWEEKYGAGIIWPDQDNCGMTFTDEGATGNNGFAMTGHYISAKMREYAAAPQVSLTAQIDGIMGDEETLMNGQQYEVKYGSNVNISVLMKDFAGIQATYHVKINDVETDTLIAEDTGRKMFSLNDITTDTKVTVYYSAEGYFDSAEFTFTIAVVSDATVEKDLLIDGATDITAANDEFVPWEFSAEQTDENGTAFVASNSGLLGYYGKAVSSLKFTVDGAGTLEFDFKIYKRTCWLIYGDQPVSTTDLLGGAGKQDSNKETVWWINSEDKSWERIIARGWTDAKEISGNNYMYWFKGADYDGGKTYTLLEDGWAHVSIPVGEDGKQKDIYVSYFRNADDYQGTRPFKDIDVCDYAAIRNVGFFKGKTTVNYSAEGNGTISATSGGKGVDSGTQIAKGGRITFKASANEGNQFYGWTTKDGTLLSTNLEFTTAVTVDTYTIKAIFGTTGQYYIRNDGKFYEDLTTAINGKEEDGSDKAKAGDKLIVIQDGLTISTNIELPAGVSLVLPVNDRGDYYELGTNSNSGTRVPWSSEQLIKQYKHFTLTVASNVTLTIKGSLFVGAVEHHPEQFAQGATSGKYNELILHGDVIVDEGGHLDVYGLVSGEGGITVKKGGKLTQPFMILDYSGGTNTQASFNAGVTPFKMYAMVNIQCAKGYTVEYGGELWGHASLFFWGGVTTIDTPFITWAGAEGDSENALLILKNGAKVTSIYDDGHTRVTGVNNVEDVGKTTMTVTGGAKAGYMQFPLGINTSGVYFSLPYNYELILQADEEGNGTYDVANYFKLMPGSVVRVEEGATLNVVGGKGLHVYDSFFIPNVAKRTYPTGTQLTGAGYKPYASLIVNGTLNVQNGATFVGTVQTEGTNGKIVVGETATLSASLFDGVETQYSCNYTKYTLTAQVYDAAHKCMGKLEAGKTYTSVAPVKDATWQLPGITFQYETKTGAHSGAHTLGDITTDGATLETGSWKLEHGGHQYDWSQLSDEEKNLNGKKYKELTHQCTEIGCTEKEHKLLLAEEFDFHATYKGAEFDNADLLAIFYQYYFEQDKVPDDYKSYFSASVTGASSIQNAQTYAGITVTLTNGYFGDVSKTSATTSFTVDKFDVKNLDKSAIENAIEEKKFTYDGTEKQLSNEELEAVLKAEGLTGGVSHEAFVWENNTNAGTGTASVTIKGSGTNFEGELTVNFSIAKAQLTVTLEETTQIYGETVKTPDITLGGVVNNEESQIKAAITRTPQAEQWSEVGNYAVDWSYSEGEGVLANYEISFNNKEETLYRVTAKDITKSATATAESATYNGKEQEAKLSFTFEGYTEHFGTGDYTVSYAKDGETSPVNAGTYTVTIKAQGNYSGSITCNYTIEKAQVTVIVTQQTYTFDRTQHSYNDQADGAWTAEGLQNEENKSLLDVSITGSGTDANTYAVTCSYNENGNYTVTFEGKETALVIEAAEIDSVTVTSSHTYDGQTYTPTLTVKAGELELNPSEYDVSYNKEEVKNADTYTVTVTAKESGNFKDKAEKASAQFRIEKATVTITAENKHSPQKQDLLELTAKVEGLVGNDELQKDVDYTLTLPEGTTKDSAVDTYTITVTVKEGRETAWPNYEIKTVNGQYQITIAAFAELVFNDASKPYNGEAQKIEATLPHSDQGEYSVEYAYWKGEAESGQSISADEMVNAGKYTIVATVSFADNNGETYEATFTATLTIEKIKVTVKFEAKSSTYGEAVETDLTYTMSEGVLAKDTETVKAAIEPYTDAESKSNVGGSYKITAAKPVLDNYDVTIEDGVYTITARPVTVTVKKQTATFNQGAQKASSETAYWTVDGLAEGDEATVLNVKLEAEGTDAKAYDIAASYQNNNYTVTFKAEGDLTVEGSTVKAAFVIEAATLTGAELTGSYTYNGNEQTPTFTVKAGSLTVAEGDYELAYADGADRVSAGTVQVTVKPKSENYTGTVETQFTIAQKQIKVTLLAQTAEYSGEVPTPAQDKYTIEEGGLCSRNGKEDDLGITITLVNGQKDAGDYGLTAEASNDDYEVTFEKSAKFTVTKKAITVKADDLTSVYGEAVQKLTYTAEGLVAGEDPQTVLKIELQASRSIKEAGTYEVTGTGSATNYTFEVTPGTYTVKEREVTVKINDQSALYNGKEPSVPQEQNKGWTITDGSIIDGDNLLIVLTKEKGVNADDYEINGAFTNDNYKVTFEGTLGTAGKFTINARTLTVVIEDQSATYNYQHQYTFDTAKWHVKADEGDGLAEGEEKDILSVTLTKPEMTDAGDYEIAGAWNNENYTVTFEGTKQTKGTFTVEKQDVSDGAKFVLGVEGDFTTDGARGVRAKFAGEELVLFASASYFEGTEDKTLEVTIDPAKIGEIGEFEVTVTIADKNYCGQTVFNVVVTDAAGYTKKLTEVLEQLATLAKGLDIDALKAEDYATLTEMYKAMQTLDEEERETGAPALAEYQAYIDAWNALADTDAAAETAESIANGPIKGLFAGTAVMTALAALAYIVKKGGIL